MPDLGEVFQAIIGQAFAQQGIDTRARTPVGREAYWRRQLGDQGSISKPKKSIGEKLEGGAINVLGKVGVPQKHAQRIGKKAFSAVNDLTPVGAAVEADEAKRAFKRKNYLGAAGHGLLAAISAAPEGGAAKAMFLGVMAKNADKIALKTAEQMAAKGVERKQILDQTGWFKGVDDKWRFEVPDNAMTLDAGAVPNNFGHANTMANKYAQKRFGKDMLDLTPGTPERDEINSFYKGIAGGDKKALAEDVISHPELYENYPGARHIGIGEERGRGLNGSWQSDSGVLRLTHTDADKMRSTAGHELQHFVQAEEGFARGGMPGSFQGQKDMALAQIHAVNQELGNLARAMDATPRGSQYDQLKQQYDTLMERKLTELVPTAQIDPYDAYRRLAGEVEARNVQTRLDMTPEQRRAQAPWETQDVPDGQQIINFLGNLGGGY